MRRSVFWIDHLKTNLRNAEMGELEMVDTKAIQDFSDQIEGKIALKSAEILIKTNHRFPVDLITRTPEEVKNRLAMGDFFVKEVLAKGRVLYEAANA